MRCDVPNGVFRKRPVREPSHIQRHYNPDRAPRLDIEQSDRYGKGIVVEIDDDAITTPRCISAVLGQFLC